MNPITIVIAIIIAFLLLNWISTSQKDVYPWEYEQCLKETGNRYCNGPRGD